MDVAIGCATPAAPDNGWVERGGSETAVVGCNFTRQRWYLHCAGRQWVGDTRNCTLLMNHAGLYANPGPYTVPKREIDNRVQITSTSNLGYM